MKSLLFAMLPAVALTAGGVAAQTREPVYPDDLLSTLTPPFVVTDASWIEAPKAEYPLAATASGVSAGAVQLSCIVTIEGRAADCQTVETPPGLGFAGQALSALIPARLVPRTVNGVAVESRISFRMNFRLEE